MMNLNPPTIEPVVTHLGTCFVVRDDLIPGGTKARFIPAFIGLHGETDVVYASPAYGYAQIALAHAATARNMRAHIFTAGRSTYHPRTIEAERSGAILHPIRPGYLSVVQARAREFADDTGAQYLPFGFDFDGFRDAITSFAQGLHLNPPEVWCVAGSGTLARSLAAAWPDSRMKVIAVGKPPVMPPKAFAIPAPEPFERDAKYPPPYPSTSNFDAKAWRFIHRHALPGSLIWNVAA